MAGFIEGLARDLLLASVTVDQLRNAAVGDVIVTHAVARDVGVLGTRGEISLRYTVRKARKQRAVSTQRDAEGTEGTQSRTLATTETQRHGEGTERS